jgi:hypothetical protein
VEKMLRLGTREIKFFAYSGSGGKVRVLKIVKQIQTNVKQNDGKKKMRHSNYLD